jgi:diguanylate cyclase (GGDEF)-like protein
MTLIDRTKAPLNKKKTKPALNIMLTVVQGSEMDFGKTYHFSQHAIRIGRDKKNTIQLDDLKVSKQHCEISVVKTADMEQIVVKDLGSTNGTYVNNELIRQRILSSGDKITVGETVFRFNYNDEIEEEYHSKLFNFAAVDALTGLYNRRYIRNELEKQSKIARRNERVFSIVVIDIDDFKRINDTFGHHAGDEYLKQVAFIIKHSQREQDISGRLGGEEFLIILPETNLDGAFHLANRIRKRIEETELIYQDNTINATISAGVGQYKPGPTDAAAGTVNSTDQLFKQADEALYRAKNSGKNKIVKAKI